MYINDKYKIESDPLNVILFQKIEPKPKKKDETEEDEPLEENTKEPGWRPIGYYSNIKKALYGLIEHEINGTGFKEVQDIVDKIEELKQLILSLKLD